MNIENIIKAIGIIFIVIAIVYLLKPEVAKRLMEFFKQGKRMYIAALIRFVLAVVFLLAARECSVTRLIAAFGILFFISGLLVFILGIERVRAYINWWQKQSLLLLRLMALIALAFGVLIIYAA